MKSKLYLAYWFSLALLVLWADYNIGPHVQFPVLFVIPVILAAWYSGGWFGLGLAVTMPLIRLYYTTLWEPNTLADLVINAFIRIAVLALLSYLVDRVAQQNRALAKEVEILKGLLPICSFCKKIRNDEQQWEPLEQYLSAHSQAEFSHGFCPDCLKKHYGDYFPDRT